ncbi:MAG: helix-turn-helix domain-containing protein [Bacteroidales bacterium]|nr:helix-turn-helix domain-containing protein [Bacteroidales bacterium]
MGIMEQIGEDIKARRKVLSITQRTLAELAEVGINTLTRIEKGEGNPSLAVLEKIADTLGMELKLVIKQK